MTPFVDADSGVVAAAHGVLTGERADGTRNVRRAERRDGSTFVYRLDRYADARGVGPGEIPDAGAVRWRADRALVECEYRRRGLDR
jgi:hypothetical protein